MITDNNRHNLLYAQTFVLLFRTKQWIHVRVFAPRFVQILETKVSAYQMVANANDYSRTCVVIGSEKKPIDNNTQDVDVYRDFFFTKLLPDR